MPDPDDGFDPTLDCAALGPGRRRCTPGPLIDAYLGVISGECTACGARPFALCADDTGHLRKTPCPARHRGARTA